MLLHSQILTLVRRVSDVILLKKELINQRYILLQSLTDLYVIYCIRYDIFLYKNKEKRLCNN